MDDFETLALAAAAKKRQENQTKAPGDFGGVSAAAIDGALLGFGDEYFAGLASVLGYQPDGQGGSHWFDYEKPIGERYDMALKTIRQEQQAYADENPGKALSAEMAGAIVGPGKILGSAVKSANSTRAQVASGSALGGAYAGAYGYGEGEGGVDARLDEAADNAPLGLVAGGVLSGVGARLGKVIERLRARKDTAEALPTVESLNRAAQSLYAAAEQSGARIPKERMIALSKSAENIARNAGYDEGLHPRITAALNRLASERASKSLAEMEILRRVTSNAAASIQPDERRIAMKLVDQIDRATKTLGGDAQTVSAAREMWGKMRRLEKIEEIFEKAATYESFEKGLQSLFRTFVRNRKNLRGFSKEEVAAIRRVANGTFEQKSLKALGDLLSARSLSGVALAGGGIATVGPAAIALPIAGYAARRASGAMIKSNAKAAQSTVAGVRKDQPTNALSAATPSVAPVSNTGEAIPPWMMK